jgi:hypothetical protein
MPPYLRAGIEQAVNHQCLQEVSPTGAFSTIRQACLPEVIKPELLVQPAGKPAGAPLGEWRLHRLWFEQTAMADLLGADYALVEKNALYRCLDKLLPHKRTLFHHLTERWQDLFGVRFDILLYDLTSTYFESPPPQDEKDKRRFGYSLTSGATACKSSLP